MENKSYIVYMHISPSNKRYIGITSQEPKRRWQNGKGYYKNIHFTNAINKYGWDNFQHIIMATDLTEQQAKEMEIELIAKYDTTNQNKGYNQSKGGEGGNGCERSEEYKQQASERMKGRYNGENNPNYGNPNNFHHTEETKQKISIANSGENNPNYGNPNNFHHTEEFKQRQSEINSGENNPMYGKDWREGKTEEEILEHHKKISIAVSGNNHPNATKVICFIDNKPFMAFDYIKQAMEYFGIKGSSNISYACQGYKIIKGKEVKVNYCGKYNGKKIVWRYLETIEL